LGQVSEKRQETEALRAETMVLVTSNDLTIKEILVKKEQIRGEYDNEIAEMQESYDLLMTDLVMYKQQLFELIGSNKENTIRI